MTTEAPWMRVFTRDWLARTGGLTPSDKGILSDLNAIMHERGAPVVFNEKLLAARCRATPKSFAKSVDTLIEAGLVSLEDGFLWSEDMQRQIEFQEKKSVNGKSAAKKRHEKKKQNQSSASADAMPYQMQNIEDDPPIGDRPSSTSSFDKSDAPDTAPFGATGASDASVDDDDWFENREFEELGDDESVEDFLRDGVHDLPIRASAAGWRKMLAWVGENCGSSAMRDAVAHRRAGTLTIEMIEALRRKNSNVA